MLTTAVTYAFKLKVMTVTENHYSNCSVFAFGFETCIEQSYSTQTQLKFIEKWQLKAGLK